MADDSWNGYVSDYENNLKHFKFICNLINNWVSLLSNQLSINSSINIKTIEKERKEFRTWIIAQLLEGITDITAQLKRLLEEYSFVKTEEGVND